MREDPKVKLCPFPALLGRDTESKPIPVLRGRMDVKTWTSLTLISLTAVIILTSVLILQLNYLLLATLLLVALKLAAKLAPSL